VECADIVELLVASHLVALVRAAAIFVDGVKVEREDRRSVA
jgi:hypothetical protein